MGTNAKFGDRLDRPTGKSPLDGNALARRARGETFRTIARDYGVTPGAVSSYWRRWKHLVGR